jgi:hypothetical protein
MIVGLELEVFEIYLFAPPLSEVSAAKQCRPCDEGTLTDALAHLAKTLSFLLPGLRAAAPPSKSSKTLLPHFQRCSHRADDGSQILGSTRGRPTSSEAPFSKSLVFSATRLPGDNTGEAVD